MILLLIFFLTVLNISVTTYLTPNKSKIFLGVKTTKYLRLKESSWIDYRAENSQRRRY